MQISGIIHSNVLNRHRRRQMFQRLTRHAETKLTYFFFNFHLFSFCFLYFLYILSLKSCFFSVTRM